MSNEMTTTMVLTAMTIVLETYTSFLYIFLIGDVIFSNNPFGVAGWLLRIG